jgi:hypothetical protein
MDFVGSFSVRGNGLFENTMPLQRTAVMEGVGAMRAGDGTIVKSNSFRPTTNNRSYGHR